MSSLNVSPPATTRWAPESGVVEQHRAGPTADREWLGSLTGFQVMAETPPTGRGRQRSHIRQADVEALLRLATVLAPSGDPDGIVAEALRRTHAGDGVVDDAQALRSELRHHVAELSRGTTPLAAPSPRSRAPQDAATPHGQGRGTWDDVVADALGGLKETLRVAVRLVDTVGLTYEEAAELLDVPVDRIAADVVDARSRLRAAAASAGLAPTVPDAAPPPVDAGGLRGWLGRPQRRRTTRCLHVASVLQAYLDAELPPAVATGIKRHLRMCKRCGLEARTYRLLKGALSTGPVDRHAVAELQRFAASLRQRA